MNILFSIIGLGLLITAAMNTYYAYRYKVPNMPTLPQTRSKITHDIRARFDDCEGLIIYDLGSGWGGVVRKLACYFPKATVKGFEISPIPFIWSKLISFFSFLRPYRITRQNIFDVDLSQVDIVICYLTDIHMRELGPKTKSEMKSGSIIYSQGFEIPNMTPIATMGVKYSLEGKIYIYQI